MRIFMNEAEKERCKAWIEKYLLENHWKREDSYILKHLFQKMTGIYASDTEFQEMLKECGHDPVEGHKSVFNVRVDSVVIQNVYYDKKIDGKGGD